MTQEDLTSLREKASPELIDALARWIDKDAFENRPRSSRNQHAANLARTRAIKLAKQVLKFRPIAQAQAELSSLKARVEKAEKENANLRLQAQSWAMEARGHKATVHEAYQAVTGATGEPGSWNGAVPIKGALAQAEARATQAEADNAKLRAELTICSDELASEIEARYAGVLDHPSMKRRYDRDIETVEDARALLAALNNTAVDEPSALLHSDNGGEG